MKSSLLLPSLKIPLHKKCKIVGFHPANIWALNKSSGILTHPNSGKSSSTALLQSQYDQKNECYRWKDKMGNWQSLYLVHRLDSPTSGLLLTTTDYDIASQLKDAFHKKEVQKTYLAVVSSNGKPIRKCWEDNLEKKQMNGKVRVVAGRSGHSATTYVSIKNRKHTKIGELLLLEMKPQTGRTHQLRVQCAKRKMPILGDRTYGDFSLNRKFSHIFKESRLFLHSAGIAIKIKNNQGSMIDWKVESSTPDEFSNLFD